MLGGTARTNILCNHIEINSLLDFFGPFRAWIKIIDEILDI